LEQQVRECEYTKIAAIGTTKKNQRQKKTLGGFAQKGSTCPHTQKGRKNSDSPPVVNHDNASG